MGRWWRQAAVLVSVVAWAGLFLQAWLLLARFAEDEGIALGIWRYFGFFTILSNIAAAVVTTRAALRPEDRPSLRLSQIELATISSIAMVGIIYGLLLRGLRTMHGLDLLADHVLHDITPILFVLFWILRPHSALGWRDAVWALPIPMAYCVYALSRGAIDGWYAYFFLDPNHMTLVQLAGSMMIFSVAFFAMGLLLVALDRFVRKPRLPAG